MHMGRYCRGTMYHQGCRSVSPLSTDGLALPVTGDPLSRAEAGSVTTEPALPWDRKHLFPASLMLLGTAPGSFHSCWSLLIVSSQLPAASRWLCYVCVQDYLGFGREHRMD